MSSPVTSNNSAFTLLDQLRREPPILQDTSPKQASIGNTKHPGWPQPNHIITWKDFSFPSLELACDGLFDRLLSYNIKPLDFEGHFPDKVCFTAERSLEVFLQKWTHTVVSYALRETQSRCESFTVPHILMKDGSDSYVPKSSNTKGLKVNSQNSSASSTQGGSFDSMNSGLEVDSESMKPPKKRKTAMKPRIGSRSMTTKELPDSLPDWGGVISATVESPGFSRPPNILPGDTKVGRKWNTTMVVNELRKAVPNAMSEARWPFRQLLNYLNATRVRYGYIITDREVVVVRLSKSSAVGELMAHGRSTMVGEVTMEFRSVPYETNGNDKLTINMALWWLHLLARQDRRILARYDPLKDTQFTNILSDDLSMSSSVPQTPFSLHSSFNNRFNDFGFDASPFISPSTTPKHSSSRQRSSSLQYEIPFEENSQQLLPPFMAVSQGRKRKPST
jgi:hypothetical protein